MDGGQSPPASSYLRQKRLCILGLLIPACAMGVALALFDDNDKRLSLVRYVIAVAAGLMVSAWCFFDSLERRATIGRGMTFGLVLLTPLVLPIYLLRTRGWRGLISSILALGIGAVFILTSLAACALTSRISGRELPF